MKSYRKELRFHTKTRRAYVNITPQVEAALAESGVREGLCLVNAMHITASVFVNDNESGLHRDFEKWLLLRYFNQNYSDAALVLFGSGSWGLFGSPERTRSYVRKTNRPQGSEPGKNGVVGE
jgi:hypothetical protein